MKIYKNIFKNYKFKKNGIIVIGFFDSFHLGHKRILNELIKISRKRNIQNYILTYNNLPLKNNYEKKILEFEEKLESFKKIGIQNILLADNNKDFFKLTPAEFINLLKTNFNINEYIISKDFKFGYKKSGGISDLKKADCIINYIEPLKIKHHLVSTSFIKKLIVSGNIEYANLLLGHNFYIPGVVKKGKQIGRTLGFPTMNIYNENILYPQDGVYFTKTFIKNKGYKSMTYVNQNVIESYLIGYNKFRYNFKIRVDFFKKIRDNAVFKDDSSLKKQLEKDLIEVNNYFK